VTLPPGEDWATNPNYGGGLPEQGWVCDDRDESVGARTMDCARAGTSSFTF
jgi:hypothetical protein